MKPTRFSLVKNDSKKQEKINSLAKRYQEAKGKQAAIEEEIEALKGEVNVLLDSQGVDSVSTADFILTRSFVSRESFSLVKAKPILGTALDRFISVTQNRTIRVQETRAAVQETDTIKKAA